MTNGMLKKLNSRKGMTLAEVLTVVAILLILAGFAFVAVTKYQRTLKQTELDNTAEEIFVAAQNHASVAKASGSWGITVNKYKDGNKEALGTPAEDLPSFPKSEETGNAHDYYAITVDAGHTVQNSILSYLLPEGSIDESIRANGNIVIEYDAETAAVYAAWYCEPSRISELTDHYQKNFTDVIDADWRDDRDERMKAKPQIGYYGGAEALEKEAENPSHPKGSAVIENNDALSIYAYSENDISVTARITGADSGAVYDAVSGWKSQGKAKCFVIDSVSENGRHFSRLGKEFIPGENLNIDVYFSTDPEFKPENEAKADPETFVKKSFTGINSLFASLEKDGGDGVAHIQYARHLQNLNTEVSGVNSSEETIAKAELDNSIDWDRSFTDAGKGIPGTTGIGATTSDNPGISPRDNPEQLQIYDESDDPIADTDSFLSICNQDLESFNGNNLNIDNIHLIAADKAYTEETKKQPDTRASELGNAGLFATGAEALTVRDLTMINPYARGTKSVGALIGYADANTIIDNVTVYAGDDLAYRQNEAGVDATDANETYFTNNAAGGLVGYANQIEIRNSSASIRVLADHRAGGLVGEIDRKGSDQGGTSITNSYVGGNNSQTYNVTAQHDNNGSAAGGLIGMVDNSKQKVTIENCYSTASVSGYFAGGLIGRLYTKKDIELNLTDAYAAGITDQTSSRGGLFIGEVQDSETDGITANGETGAVAIKGHDKLKLYGNNQKDETFSIPGIIVYNQKNVEKKLTPDESAKVNAVPYSDSLKGQKYPYLNTGKVHHGDWWLAGTRYYKVVFHDENGKEYPKLEKNGPSVQNIEAGNPAVVPVETENNKQIDYWYWKIDGNNEVRYFPNGTIRIYDPSGREASIDANSLSSTVLNVNSDLDVYVRYKHSVNFWYNTYDTVTGEIVDQKKLVTETIENENYVLDLPQLPKIGATEFKGWYSEANPESSLLADKDDASINVQNIKEDNNVRNIYALYRIQKAVDVTLEFRYENAKGDKLRNDMVFHDLDKIEDRKVNVKLTDQLKPKEIDVVNDDGTIHLADSKIISFKENTLILENVTDSTVFVIVYTGNTQKYTVRHVFENTISDAEIQIDQDHKSAVLINRSDSDASTYQKGSQFTYTEYKSGIPGNTTEAEPLTVSGFEKYGRIQEETIRADETTSVTIHYRRKKNKVYYDLSGGKILHNNVTSGHLAPESLEYGETVTLPAEDTTKTKERTVSRTGYSLGNDDGAAWTVVKKDVYDADQSADKTEAGKNPYAQGMSFVMPDCDVQAIANWKDDGYGTVTIEIFQEKVNDPIQLSNGENVFESSKKQYDYYTSQKFENVPLKNTKSDGSTEDVILDKAKVFELLRSVSSSDNPNLPSVDNQTSYEHFTFNDELFESENKDSKTVKSDGTTVVRLYYDRDLIKLKFNYGNYPNHINHSVVLDPITVEPQMLHILQVSEEALTEDKEITSFEPDDGYYRYDDDSEYYIYDESTNTYTPLSRYKLYWKYNFNSRAYDYNLSIKPSDGYVRRDLYELYYLENGKWVRLSDANLVVGSYKTQTVKAGTTTYLYSWTDQQVSIDECRDDWENCYDRYSGTASKYISYPANENIVMVTQEQYESLKTAIENGEFVYNNIITAYRLQYNNGATVRFDGIGTNAEWREINGKWVLGTVNENTETWYGLYDAEFQYYVNEASEPAYNGAPFAYIYSDDNGHGPGEYYWNVTTSTGDSYIFDTITKFNLVVPNNSGSIYGNDGRTVNLEASGKYSGNDATSIFHELESVNSGRDASESWPSDPEKYEEINTRNPIVFKTGTYSFDELYTGYELVGYRYNNTGLILPASKHSESYNLQYGNRRWSENYTSLHGYYARKKYTISFADVRNAISQDYLYKDKLTKLPGKNEVSPPDLPDIDSDYQFAGWFDSESEDATQITDAEGNVLNTSPYQEMPAHNLQLFAHWKAPDVTITYLNMLPDDEMKEVTVSSDTEVSELDIPEEDGRVFVGWYMDETRLQPLSSDDSVKAGKVYARMTTAKSDPEHKNSNPVLYKPDTITPEGYRFDGWYRDPQYNEQAVSGALITEDTVLYAHWSKTNTDKVDVIIRCVRDQSDEVSHEADVDLYHTKLQVSRDKELTLTAPVYDDDQYPDAKGLKGWVPTKDSEEITIKPGDIKDGMSVVFRYTNAADGWSYKVVQKIVLRNSAGAKLSDTGTFTETTQSTTDEQIVVKPTEITGFDVAGITIDGNPSSEESSAVLSRPEGEKVQIVKITYVMQDNLYGLFANHKYRTGTDGKPEAVEPALTKFDITPDIHNGVDYTITDTITYKDMDGNDLDGVPADVGYYYAHAVITIHFDQSGKSEVLWDSGEVVFVIWPDK